MNQARIVFHLARADFYERVRRYNFVTLGLAVFLGYQVAVGNLMLDSANIAAYSTPPGVGAMMSLNATF